MWPGPWRRSQCQWSISQRCQITGRTPTRACTPSGKGSCWRQSRRQTQGSSRTASTGAFLACQTCGTKYSTQGFFRNHHGVLILAPLHPSPCLFLSNENQKRGLWFLLENVGLFILFLSFWVDWVKVSAKRKMDVLITDGIECKKVQLKCKLVGYDIHILQVYRQNYLYIYLFPAGWYKCAYFFFPSLKSQLLVRASPRAFLNLTL